MALSTYTELKASIADYLNRDDLTATIPDFIALTEAQVNRDVRHWQMENRATATIDSQYLSRPSDWVETIRLHLTGGNTSAMVLLSSQAMASKRQGSENVSGKPEYYRHAESQYEIFPTPDASYAAELHYIQKIPSLSDSNASNWLLSDSPDVYLFGALLNASPYLGEDARISVWGQLYLEATKRLNAASVQSTSSSDGLTMKIRGLG